MAKKRFCPFFPFIVLDTFAEDYYNFNIETGIHIFLKGKANVMNKTILSHGKNSILLQWVLICIIILLIPVVSIVFNFLVSRKIINEQIRKSNYVALSHLQKTIDQKLQSIKNLSHLLLLDNSFLYLSETSEDRSDFFTQVQACYEELANYNYIYSDMNILIYYPAIDYILTTGAANTSASVYDSMSYSYQGEMISYEEWMDTIGADYSRARYFLDCYSNYNYIGKDSFVFACNHPFVYQEENNFTIFVSSKADFIEGNLRELSQYTFFICDQNNNIIQQFGASVDGISQLDLSPSETSSNLNLNGENYFCCQIPSTVTGWIYVLAIPSSLYLKDSIRMRDLTMFSTFVSLLVGIFIILYTQYRNYKPVRKLIDVIPISFKTDKTNEFQQIEAYHGEMSRSNQFMQNQLKNISKNVREFYFYSKLKNIEFHAQEKDIIHTLQLNFSGKHFVVVSVYADSNSSSSSDVLQNWDLLQFVIDNVSEEILGGHFNYESIQDGFFRVFLFALDGSQLEEWKLSGESCFKRLYSFLSDKFRIELFITVSQVYENFEQTARHYSDVIASFEECYARRESGVCIAKKSDRRIPADYTRFKEYCRDINLSVFRGEYEGACAVVHNYMEELKTYHFSKIIIRYNIYSLIASVLMDAGEYISQATRDAVDAHLSAAFFCDTIEEYEEKIKQMLRYLCGQGDAAGENIQGHEAQLVKKIKNYVDNYYSDASLNVASVADAISLSPNYMSKIFKNYTGESLLSYINAVRINHAKEYLRVTNISVDEISVLAGFSNARSFRRNFQNLTGMTASDYRNEKK